MRNEDSDRSVWDASPARRLTPADVQQKQFRTARLGGGYRMREVDEFLDEITDALASLLAENERLRRARPDGSASPETPVRPVSAGDRAAIEAFLQREKGFLQDLGSLVQGHAEGLKSMVRAARSATPAAEPEAPLTAAPAAEPEAPLTAAPAAEPEAPLTAAPAASEVPGAATSGSGAPSVTPAAAPDDEPTSDQEEAGDEGSSEIVGRDEGTAAMTPAGEPIRLDEPEPAGPRRGEEEPEGSLRELFWGEE